MKRIWPVALALLLLAGCAGDQSVQQSPEPVWSDPVPANEYRSEAFAVSDGFLRYLDGACAVGVDVSAHQGEIDWEAAAQAGVEFAMIRAGYRGYTQGGLYEDEYFRANMEGAQAAGLDVGVYFFSQAVSEAEAVEEAEFVLSLLEGYELTYPVAFDWEEQTDADSRTRGIGGTVQTACALAFCRRVEQAGLLPMVYFSPAKGYGELDLEQLMDWPFWLAHYTEDWAATSFRYRFAMWQYADDGVVPGLGERVDLNLCLVEFEN